MACFFRKAPPKQIVPCSLIIELLKHPEFTKSASINLKALDTVVIIDKKNQLNDCFFISGKRYGNYFIKILSNDIAPDKFITFREEEKYRGYITLENMTFKKDTIEIYLSRKMSNHTGYFKYLNRDGKYKLLDYRIGQY